MAWLERDRANSGDTVHATIIVTGTPRATELLWGALTTLAAHGTAEGELVIPGTAARSGEGEDEVALDPRPVRLRLVRRPPPEPELPHIALMSLMCGSTPHGDTTLADGLILAVDLDASGAARSRHLLGVCDEVLPLLENALPALETADAGAGPVARSLPRVLLGFGTHESAPTWRNLGELWLGAADAYATAVAGPPTVSLLRALLRHLDERARRQWQRCPPLPETLTPRLDLPPSLQEESERCARAASSPLASSLERASALLRQGQLYRRAGLAQAAGVLVREALQEPLPEAWEALPPMAPLPGELQCLRSWTLPPASAGALAVVDEGRAMLLAIDGALWRLERHEARPQPLPGLQGHPIALREAGVGRALVVARELALVDAVEGTVLARRELRGPLRAAIESARSERVTVAPRVDLDVEQDRVLLVLSSGLYLYRLSELTAVAMLERDDVIAAGLGAQGEVLTVHRGGTLGRWLPGAAIVERVGAVGVGSGGQLRDASVSGHTGRVATLGGVSRRGPRLQVSEVESGVVLLDEPTEQATSVRLSADGERVLTLEHRILRVREVPRSRREEGVAARTLLEPPPWMPLAVDVTTRARFVGVLARTVAGLSALRVNLWG